MASLNTYPSVYQISFVKFVFIFSLLIHLNTGHSQRLHLDTIVSVEIKKHEVLSPYTILGANSGKIFLIAPSEKNKLNIHFIDPESPQKKQYTQEIKLYKGQTSTGIQAYLHKDTSLFLAGKSASQNTPYLNIYNLKNLRKTERYTLTQNIQPQLYFKKDTLISYGVYNYHPMEITNRSGLTLHAYKGVADTVLAVGFTHIEQTHLKPNNYLDVLGNQYAVASPFSYKILLFDLSTNKCTDSVISENHPYFRNHTENMDAEKIARNPKEYLGILQAGLKKHCRIWSVHFLDSHTLILLYSVPAILNDTKTFHLYTDVLSKNAEGIWNITEIYNHFEKMNSTEFFSNQNFRPAFVAGSKILFDKEHSKMYFLYWSSVIPNSDLTLSEVYALPTAEKHNLKIAVFSISPR